MRKDEPRLPSWEWMAMTMITLALSPVRVMCPGLGFGRSRALRATNPTLAARGRLERWTTGNPTRYARQLCRLGSQLGRA
jgi:hypothetical protein